MARSLSISSLCGRAVLHLLAALHRTAVLPHLLHVSLHHFLMLFMVLPHEFPLFFFQALAFFVVLGGKDLVHEFVHFQHMILRLPNVLLELFVSHASHHAHASHHSAHASHLVLAGGWLGLLFLG
ncbi:hypothetical protein [Methylocaldum szegediense]|uniref:hypothetical protein n=1 Tax=Methylocaldum szegediense TaxID=73780 RepID=UPI0012EB9B9B|nr:hypothetical protein [Methylocaldum szegediense]